MVVNLENILGRCVTQLISALGKSISVVFVDDFPSDIFETL